MLEAGVGNWKDLWQAVRMGRLNARNSIAMNVPGGAEPPSDVLAILGNMVTVQKSEKWDPWLLRMEASGTGLAIWMGSENIRTNSVGNF